MPPRGVEPPVPAPQSIAMRPDSRAPLMWSRLARKRNLLLVAALVVAAALGVTMCYLIFRKVPSEDDARAVVVKQIEEYSHGMVRLLSFQKTKSSSNKFNTFGQTGVLHTILYTGDIQFTGEAAWNRQSWFIASGPPQPRSESSTPSILDAPPDEHIRTGERYRVTGTVTFAENLEHPPGQWLTSDTIGKAERIGVAPTPVPIAPIARAKLRPETPALAAALTPTPVPDNAAIELAAINVFPENDRVSGSVIGFRNVSDRGIKAFRGRWHALDDFGEVTRSGAFAYTSQLFYIDARGSDFPATGHIVAPGEIVYLMDVAQDGHQRQYAMSDEAGKAMLSTFSLPTSMFNPNAAKPKYRAAAEKVVFATPAELQGALAQRAARPPAAVAQEKATPPRSAPSSTPPPLPTPAPAGPAEEVAEKSARQRCIIVGVPPGDSLNVHSGPAMKSSTVFTLANGDAVQIAGSTVLNGETEWFPIVCASGTGWVSRKYLEPAR